MRYINQFNRIESLSMYNYEEFERDDDGNIILRDEIEMIDIDPYSEYDGLR